MKGQQRLFIDIQNSGSKTKGDCTYFGKQKYENLKALVLEHIELIFLSELSE